MPEAQDTTSQRGQEVPLALVALESLCNARPIKLPGWGGDLRPK